MWTIILLNEQCQFRSCVKKTTAEYYPCSHTVNADGLCAERFCPIDEKRMNESRNAGEE